ncbi:MAG: hypothetical protein R2864_02595 [Syntrophotaleaceae bacterium]
MSNGRILYEKLSTSSSTRAGRYRKIGQDSRHTPELLLGKPTIDQALPMLHYFTEGRCW